MKQILSPDKVLDNLLKLQKFYWESFKGNSVEPLMANISEALYTENPKYK